MRANTRVLRAWTLALLWAALVWNLGGDAFSSAQTSRFLDPLLEWLLPSASPALLGDLLFGVHKAAHIVEYGVLALLIIRALWTAWAASPRAALAVTLALLACLAAGDELRQSGTLARTGSGHDVLLDLGGALLALLALFAMPRRWQLQKFSRPDPMA